MGFCLFGLALLLACDPSCVDPASRLLAPADPCDPSRHGKWTDGWMDGFVQQERWHLKHTNTSCQCRNVQTQFSTIFMFIMSICSSFTEPLNKAFKDVMSCKSNPVWAAFTLPFVCTSAQSFLLDGHRIGVVPVATLQLKQRWGSRAVDVR